MERNSLIFACCCLLAIAKACAQSAVPPPPPPARPAEAAKPRRVITDVSSFHLEHMRTAANQIGLASRGNDEPFVLCAPALGVSGTTHPLFEWRSPNGPTATLIFQLLGANNRVLYTHPVTGYMLEYPVDAPALQPGRTYTWQLADPANAGPPLSARVEIAAKTHAQPTASDALDEAQLVLARELWYDAVATLKTGIARHPERKDLSQQLQALYRAIAPDCGNGR